MAWHSPSTWLPNAILTAAQLNAQVRDNLKALTEWQTYTPTFTNLTVGNGTLNAKYIEAGKLVHWRVGLVGGNTSAASGAVKISLPVTAQATMAQSVLLRVFNTAALYTGWVDISGAGTDGALYVANGANGAMAALSAFGLNHSFIIQGTYEAA